MYIKLLALVIILLGIWLGYECAKFNLWYSLKSLKFYDFSWFSSRIWNIPILSTLGVNKIFLKLGKVYLKQIDQGWFEFYGGQNLYRSLRKLSKFIQLLSKNHLKSFLFLIVI